MKSHEGILLVAGFFGQDIADGHQTTADEKTRDKSPHEHFADRKYEIWEEKLIAERISFTTAVHYIDPMKRIIDEAVVYTVIDDKVVPYLFFKPDKILNGKKLPIIDLSKHPYDFYGWQLEYSYPKNKK